MGYSYVCSEFSMTHSHDETLIGNYTSIENHGDSCRLMDTA
jgi:hypothetical protein